MQTVPFPEVYGIYDTLAGKYLEGAKGQLVFGSVGHLKRSAVHTGWFTIIKQQAFLESIGEGALAREWVQAEVDHAAMMKFALENDWDYNQRWKSPESVQLEKVRKAKGEYFNYTGGMRDSKKLTAFDKKYKAWLNGRLEIHKLHSVQAEVVKCK